MQDSPFLSWQPLSVPRLTLTFFGASTLLRNVSISTGSPVRIAPSITASSHIACNDTSIGGCAIWGLRPVRSRTCTRSRACLRACTPASRSLWRAQSPHEACFRQWAFGSELSAVGFRSRGVGSGEVRRRKHLRRGYACRSSATPRTGRSAAAARQGAAP